MKPLSRRTFLQGTGVSIALPFLEAMLPSMAYAATATPKFIVIYRGNGESKVGWANGTTTDEKGSVFTNHVSTAQPFFDSVPGLFRALSNVSFPTAHALTQMSGLPGDHNMRAACFLTGGRGFPKQGADWVAIKSATRSLDHLIADKSRTSPLVIGPVDWKQQSQRPNYEYYRNISWAGPLPATRAHTPYEVFQRLTGSASSATSGSAVVVGTTLTPAQSANNSVLDYAMDSINSLNAKIGSADKAKMDEYLTALRSQEISIQQTQISLTTVTAACKDVKNSSFSNLNVNNQKLFSMPSGFSIPSVPSDIAPAYSNDYFSVIFHQMTDQYLELIRLSMQCGLTNVATYMIDTESSGIVDDHHSWSHSKDKQGRLVFDYLNRNYSAQVAKFLKNMASTQDVDGQSLLYNSAVVYGSGLGEASEHEYSGLKMVVAGNAGGKLHPNGQYDPTKVDLNSVMLSLGNSMGLGLSNWGQSSADSTDVQTIPANL